MSYTLYKTNGTVLTTVVDGSLDTTTDLTFVGKNYSGYGTVVNQDLVKLLENFAGKLQPTKSIVGQLWYDSSNGRLKLNVGGYYKPIANIESQNTSPSNAAKSDLWYNESTGKLNFYDGSAWVVIGPQISGATSDNLVEYASISDDGGNSHNILQARTTTTNGIGVITAIISPEEFVVNSSDPLKSNFYTVKKGITLAGTDHLSGVGSTYVLWGDASNSYKLGGKSLSDLVLTASPVFQGTMTSYTNDGLSINNITRLRNDSNLGHTYLDNISGANVIIRVSLGDSLTDVINLAKNSNPANLGVPVLLPSTDARFTNKVDIGNTDYNFGSIYANNFTSLNGAVTANSLTAGTVNVSNTATVQNLAAVSSANSNIGSSTVPFTKIYADEVHASSGFYGSILGGTSAPSSSGAVGTAGSVAFDSGYVYVCIATNTWKRAALTTW